jgi:hypothetical protein
VRRVGARRAVALAIAVLALGACSSGGSDGAGSTSTPSAAGPRPASPAVVKIVEPKNGAEVPASGGSVTISLEDATLTSVTSQDISPTEGHLHVSVDDSLISMTSGLTEPLPDLEPGRHTLRVEFVAADHLPFNPRVVTQGFFEVR